VSKFYEREIIQRDAFGAVATLPFAHFEGKSVSSGFGDLEFTVFVCDADGNLIERESRLGQATVEAGNVRSRRVGYPEIETCNQGLLVKTVALFGGVFIHIKLVPELEGGRFVGGSLLVGSRIHAHVGAELVITGLQVEALIENGALGTARRFCR
jgi:hypothetical protein